MSLEKGSPPPGDPFSFFTGAFAGDGGQFPLEELLVGVLELGLPVDGAAEVPLNLVVHVRRRAPDDLVDGEVPAQAGADALLP